MRILSLALALGVVALLSGAALLLAEDAPSYQLGQYRITQISLDPATPEVGDAELTFTLLNAQGQPVDKVRVEAEIFMPAMGGMPRMGSSYTMTSLGQGRYQTTLEIAMGGGWELPIRVFGTQESEPTLFPFALTVGTPGLRYKGKAGAGSGKNAIYLDQPRRQLIGVELGQAKVRPFHTEIRTVARLSSDESKVVDMQLRFSGEIVRLYADKEGQLVRAGQPLFEIYSPELYTAQDVYIQLARQENPSKTDQLMLRTAREKLQLYNLTDSQIAELARSGRPPKKQMILSPVTGYILKKGIMQGGQVKAGMRIFQIADFSRLWALAEVYEHQAILVNQGDEALVRLSYQPGSQIHGRVDYLYPYIDEATRTLKLRIEVDNQAGLLRPGMYAEVLIRSDKGPRLSLPRRAVLFSGQHQYIFVSDGEGYFEPREIKTGLQEGDWFEVIEGVSEGEWVSFSANFLISSEAQLRDALPRWGKSNQPQGPKTQPSSQPQHGGSHD